MEGWTMKEMIHSAKHAKIMDISEDPGGVSEEQDEQVL
jgi:hypothetical protein